MNIYSLSKFNEIEKIVHKDSSSSPPDDGTEVVEAAKAPTADNQKTTSVTYKISQKVSFLLVTQKSVYLLRYDPYCSENGEIRLTKETAACQALPQSNIFISQHAFTVALSKQSLIASEPSRNVHED